MLTVSEKLAALRSLMRHHNIDAILVPNTDEYQGEYIAPYAKRLEWLTGFSGSAGFGLIFQHKALLFTDGRYQLQIRAQTDNQIFTYHNSVDLPLNRYLKQEESAFILGYDPWLHSCTEIKALGETLNQIGGSLNALEENLIDRIWEDRPPRPQNLAFAQDIKFAGRSYKEKLAQIKADLQQQNIQVFIFTDPISLAWLFNIRGKDITHIPIALCRAIIFSDETSHKDQIFIETETCESALLAYLTKFLEVNPFASFMQSLAKLKKNTNPAWVFGLDPQKTPEKIYQIFAEIPERVNFITDPVSYPKAIKNSQEIAGAIQAQKRDSLAMIRFLAWLDAQKIGTISEIDCVKKLYESRQIAGENDNMPLQDLAFDTIAGTGANGAIIHYSVTQETNKILKEGDLFLIDSGAQYKDGTTDITRTIAIGAPSTEQKYYYTLVLKALLALSLSVFPKKTRGCDLDVIARHNLWQAGVDYAHGTGHGVGSYLSVHEGPQAISPFNHVVIKAGMILSNEPGYYKEGAFGIRLENLLLIIEKEIPLKGPHKETASMLGFQTLTFCPFDRRLILKNELDEKMIAFLNHYHETIYQNTNSYLTSAEKTWLYEATRPL